MKLVFGKNDQLEISVMQKVGENSVEFNYIDMIKSLIERKALDEPELLGEFSELERNSICSMVNHINSVVSEFYAENDGKGRQAPSI